MRTGPARFIPPWSCGRGAPSCSRSGPPRCARRRASTTVIAVTAGSMSPGRPPRSLSSTTTAGRWRVEGIVHERLAASDRLRVEPALNPELRLVYFLPDRAQVRNPWHLRALAAAAAKRGVRLEPWRGRRSSGNARRPGHRGPDKRGGAFLRVGDHGRRALVGRAARRYRRARPDPALERPDRAAAA